MKTYEELERENKALKDKNAELKFRLSDYEFDEAMRRQREIDERHNKWGYKFRCFLVGCGFLED